MAQFNQLIGTIGVVAFLSACASTTPPAVDLGTTPPDVTLAADSLAFDAVGTVSFAASWNAATDDETPAASIVYELWIVAGATTTAFDELAEVKAGTRLATGANLLATDVTSITTNNNLAAGTAYLVNILAKDAADNEDVYEPQVLTTETVNNAVTFDPTVAALMDRAPAQAGCRGCHTAGGAIPVFFEANGTTFDLTTAAQEVSALVIPGNYSASTFYRRIAGTVGSRMPPVGNYMSAEEVESIRIWIADGAPLN